MASRPGYSPAQIALHWLIAVLVLFQLLFGESMSAVVRGAERGHAVVALDQTLGSAHYWVGLAILGLVAIRLLLRLTVGVPAPVPSGPGWMERAARLSHIAFYLLLVATPILGLLAFYIGGVFGALHSWSKPLFIVLIAVHVAATAFHQFWLRDKTLRRMISPAG